ncbi:hypothetical protein PPYR_10249 [Photinus pyralis]|uniref:MD-2-related lipid-recognition domain-containing protein n=1 Tax=Photinus pyralis TaxID=7054 RepID=A0A5N4AG35_PHOPY|nr:uncharacterized protein LOC116174825 [Photinus pyralis]KAB0796188.1 hypothetical protein PPYR_10249 [Photinus pyralis]
MYSLTAIHLLSLLLLCDSQMMGPPGTIILDAMGPCENNPGGDVEFNLNLQTIDSKGGKLLSVNVSTKVPIDDTVTYFANLLKWDDNGWTTVTTHSANFCADVMKFAPRVWKLVKEHSVPEIPARCSLEPGDYKVDNLRAATSDFNLPVMPYGKVKIDISLSRGGKLLACFYFDGVSQKPTRHF